MIVAIAMAIAGAARKSDAKAESDARKKLSLPLLVMLALYLIAYWRLPDQAGYLIPIIPATLLLVALYVPRWATLLLCALLIASPWISFSNGRPEAGAIVQDHRERLQTLAGVNGFLAFCRARLGPDYVVATGAWEPIIKTLSPEDAARFPYLLTMDEAKAVLKSGKHLGYASESIREFNYRVNHFDLATLGAVDVHALFMQGRH